MVARRGYHTEGILMNQGGLVIRCTRFIKPMQQRERKQMNEDKKVHTIVESAISELVAMGATRQTASVLLATQAAFLMTDLEQLRHLRSVINTCIICCDDSIAADANVVIGPCDCIIPEPKSLGH
jgi:hypothetical protein